MNKTKSSFLEKNVKYLLILFCISVLSLFLSACQSEAEKETKTEPADWAIYWYLCGSDLESKHASASKDID